MKAERYYQDIGEDIRVIQQQVNQAGERVGVNRPGLQFSYEGQRYYVEFDTPSSNRAAGHAQRTQANDPESIVICKQMP